MCESEWIDGTHVYGDYCYIPEEYMDEKWAYIDGFPDYRISNKGRIWSGRSQKFMKPTPNSRTGHMDVCLRNRRGERAHCYLHRLVAEAFIPNPNGYPIVRHLDDDPDNNWFDNLAWGTQEDNVRDAIRNGHAHFPSKEDIEKANSVRRTPVRMTDLKTGETREYVSQQEAARVLGISQAIISDSARGRTRHPRRYIFEFIEKEGD